MQPPNGCCVRNDSRRTLILSSAPANGPLRRHVCRVRSWATTSVRTGVPPEHRCCVVVSSGLSPISTGNSVPSLRRPTSSRTTPIARDRGSAWNDVRCPGCWPRNPRLPRRRPSTGCLGQQPDRVFACMYQRVEPLPHIFAELHHVPLRSNLFRRHAASPESMTGLLGINGRSLQQLAHTRCQ
jgi:hypothetical protein